jgi:hypothetical protein
MEAISESQNIKKARKEVELLIYKTMDTLDPSGANSSWYKKKFASMSDNQFNEYFKQDFPLKFQMKLFDIEPKMYQLEKACKQLNVPLMEKVYLPFIYTDNDGNPVKSNYEALVIYAPLKKMKQFLAKKNSMSINTDERNMKSGRLINKDKNGNTSDREMECLAVMGLPNTMRELATYRADSVKAKDEFYSTITEKNMVSLDDVEVDKTDSTARNTLNVYLIGAGVMSNLIAVKDSYMLPYTAENKNANRVKREN